MGEPEAYKALKEGFIIVNNEVYTIEKHPKGWCDGCCFYQNLDCPDLARKTCCTGGVIFHKQ
jgi:hypothetical protein